MARLQDTFAAKDKEVQALQGQLLTATSDYEAVAQKLKVRLLQWHKTPIPRSSTQHFLLSRSA